MKGSPGLIAVVLDDAVTQALRGLAIHPDVFCKHITMAYRPTPEISVKYAGVMGKTVEFDIVTNVFDQNGQALIVEGVPSEKAVPHITVSCAKGTQPSYSNQMFNNPERHVEPIRLRGRGVVQYVPL